MVEQKMIKEMIRYFDPATALWRSIEISEARDFLAAWPLKEPVLDLGCGEGNIARILFHGKLGFLVGLDLFAEPLSVAQGLHNYKYVLASDATKMPFKAQSFNSVFSNSVIEHIPEIDTLLKQISHILKPDGLLLLTVPDDKFGEGLFFYRLFSKLGLKKMADWYKQKRIALLQHHNLYSQKEWSDRLNKAGLVMIFSKGYITKNTLSCWDIIAAIQFAWCRIVPNAKSLPFKKMLIPLIKFICRRLERAGQKNVNTAILIAAKKAGMDG